MATATAEELQALAPYIAGAVPDSRGEIEIYCPMHNDSKRSASINPQKGVWYCHAGCGGGSLRQLVLAEGGWVPAAGRVAFALPSGGTAPVGKVPTMEDVMRWHHRLLGNEEAQEHLFVERGITVRTMQQALLGFDGRYYKIPVFSPMRRLWNVRTYNPTPKEGRSKIWNTRGMGKARLYPVGVLDRLQMGDYVFLLEGEWDTLLALQCQVPAVTRTDGAGKPWHDEWTAHFIGLRVYLCSDADRAGGDADAIAGDALTEVASVYQCDLGVKRTEKHGYDLSDHLLPHRLRRRLRLLQRLRDSAYPLEAR